MSTLFAPAAPPSSRDRSGDNLGWWRNGVTQPVYVRSFQDSDGHVIGDLGGVRATLLDTKDVAPWARAPAAGQTAAWLDAQGLGEKPIVLGEYNGFTGAAMQQAGEWILSTPELWIANVWNTDHTTFSVLTGDRLDAYRATKADPRANAVVGSFPNRRLTST